MTQEPFTVGLIEPSKLYGVMAAGRPVLYVGPPETEAARTVRREQIGEVVANGDPGGVVRALGRLLADPLEMGARARSAFEERYGRVRRTMQIAEILRGSAR